MQLQLPGLRDRPLLLDLFCGAGGASLGYWNAGWDVVGVDVRPQPHYPFRFVQADAMTFPLAGFDAVHASPPCQAFTVARHVPIQNRPAPVDLLTPTLRRFASELAGVPWIVENVPGAPMTSGYHVEVCGASVNCTARDVDGTPLVLRRHRLFATNRPLLIPACACATYRARRVRVAGVYGGGPENRRNRDGGFRGGYTPGAAVRRQLIGVEHMTLVEMAQCIPPAYTELLGTQLLAQL